VVQQHAGGDAALVADRLADGGQVEQVGHVVVVDADHRQVFGMRMPLRRAAYITPIATSSDTAKTAVGIRCSWYPQSTHILSSAAVPASIGKPVMPIRPGVDRDPVLPQRPFVAFTIGGDGEPVHVVRILSKEGDAAVPETDQVTGGRVAHLDVVDEDTRHAGMIEPIVTSGMRRFRSDDGCRPSGTMSPSTPSTRLCSARVSTWLASGPALAPSEYSSVS